MIGLIAGDCAGDGFEISRWIGTTFEEASCYAYSKEPYRPPRLNERASDFSLFREDSQISDDSVQSIAVMEWLLRGGRLEEYLLEYFRRYPDCGYGRLFAKWAKAGGKGHPNSVGNGAAMRVAPVGFVANSIDEVVTLSRRSATPTHVVDHAVRGAQAIALAVFLARKKVGKEDLVDSVAKEFGYSIDLSIDEIRKARLNDDSGFSSACAETVPVALRAVLEANDYERAIRLGISVGGDADTVAAMAGAIGGTLWGVPDWIRKEALARLDDPQRAVLAEFESRYPGSAMLEAGR